MVQPRCFSESRVDITFSRFRRRAAIGVPSRTAFLAIGLFVLGLLTNISSREEVYANLEYGFSVLALFGAAGYIGHLAASIPRRSGAWAFAFWIPTGVLPAVAVPGGVPGPAGWPVLVALLLGPLVVLLSGLGGWV